jgi:uncharacterized coiled-coil protein SlyX
VFESSLKSMTMSDWVERVCQLKNTIEHRDRVIADQKKTIASQLAIIERLRARVEKLDAKAPNHETHAPPSQPTGRAGRVARKLSK